MSLVGWNLSENIDEKAHDESGNGSADNREDEDGNYIRKKISFMQVIATFKNDWRKEN
jgi:hypothetical protein